MSCRGRAGSRSKASRGSLRQRRITVHGKARAVGRCAGRRDHEDLIRTISALDRSLLLPKASLIDALLKRGKELSADGGEKLLVLGEEARTKAKPHTEKTLETAKEATDQVRSGRAAEAAKPYVKWAKRPPGRPTTAPCAWPGS